MATGYSGDNINVNDPGYQTTSYTLSQIVDGQNGVYNVPGVSGELKVDTDWFGFFINVNRYEIYEIYGGLLVYIWTDWKLISYRCYSAGPAEPNGSISSLTTSILYI